MVSYFCNALKFINSKIMKINSNIKIFKVIKITSKTKSSHFFHNNNFSHKFEDLILMLYIWVNSIMKGTKKKIQCKQHLATTFRHLTQKTMVWSIVEHFFDPLTMLASKFQKHLVGGGVKGGVKPANLLRGELIRSTI